MTRAQRIADLTRIDSDDRKRRRHARARADQVKIALCERCQIRASFACSSVFDVHTFSLFLHVHFVDNKVPFIENDSLFLLPVEMNRSPNLMNTYAPEQFGHFNDDDGHFP